MANLRTNTYLPKWYNTHHPCDSLAENHVTVQVTDASSLLAGHATRSYEECWPHLQSREVWVNSPIFKDMEQEAFEDRNRRISSLA